MLSRHGKLERSTGFGVGSWVVSAAVLFCRLMRVMMDYWLSFLLYRYYYDIASNFFNLKSQNFCSYDTEAWLIFCVQRTLCTASADVPIPRLCDT